MLDLIHHASQDATRTGNPTLHRSKTLGFLQGEHRFFDALDCSNTKYATPSPGFNQDLAAHSTFTKSPAYASGWPLRI